MLLADLNLSALSFELRYERAYRLYDFTGRILIGLQSKWPDLVPSQTTPNITKFQLAKKVEIGLEIDKASLGWPGHNIDEEEFVEFAEALTHHVKEFLQVDYFTRIGMRQIYLKRYPTHEEATKAFKETARTILPEEKKFGVEGSIKNPEYAVRVENDELGWLGRTKVQTRKIVVEKPLGDTDIKAVDVEHTEFVFDLDLYTTAKTPAGQLKPGEWIKQGLRVCRRDAAVMLGG